MEEDREPQRRPTEQYGSGPAETTGSGGDRTALIPGYRRSVAAARPQPGRSRRRVQNHHDKNTPQLQACVLASGRRNGCTTGGDEVGTVRFGSEEGAGKDGEWGARAGAGEGSLSRLEIDFKIKQSGNSKIKEEKIKYAEMCLVCVFLCY